MRGLPQSVERDDDGEADSHLGGGDGDDKEHEDLRVVVGESEGGDAVAGEGDEGEIGRVEHQLEAHEDDEEVAAQEDAGESDGKKQTADQEIIAEGGHGLSADCGG